VTRRQSAWLVARAATTLAGRNFFASWFTAGHQHDGTAPPEPERWTNYQPQFFSPADFQTLDRFAAILLPTDETPGAREAHVAPFIDFILFSASEFAPETQAQWRTAFDWLNQHHFAEQSPAEQLAFVRQISTPSDPGFATFQLIKELTVYAFYTSRAGLIENLDYQGLAYLTEFPGCSHPEHRTI
jgi:hypothetical protein